VNATANIPFWVPIVASTLSNAHLASVLPDLSASKVATLRARFGFPVFADKPHGSAAANWLALLGQIEDEVLARLVNVRYDTSITSHLITAIRNDLGISSYSARKPKLQPRIRDMVGRYTARNIAKGRGISVKVIEAYRNLAAADIATAATMQAQADGIWKPEWIELLPHQTNAQITRATGIDPREVRAMRNTLQIAGPSTRTYWKLVSNEELALTSDEQLCALYGGPLADFAAQRLVKALEDKAVAKEISRSKQLPDHLTHFLNQMPLRRLAKLVALSEFHLKRQRDTLGIEPYNPFPVQFESLLSTRTDSEVAGIARIPVSTVRYRRNKLRMPSYSARQDS